MDHDPPMDLLVVGAGRVGRWFAGTLRDHDGVSLAFADRDADAAAAAARDVGGERVPLQTGDSETGTVPGDRPQRTFDAVCVAVPISAGPAAIRTHAARADRAVVDLTGVMTPPVAAMRETAPDRERLSLHPLFAPARAPGTVAAVVDADGPVTGRIRSALTAAGNEVVETTPGAHDEAMETVQAKAHAALLAFALAADPVPAEFATPVLTALSDVVGTVTGTDAAVYAEIQAAFDGAGDVAAAAERVAATAADARDGDHGPFADLYREAGDGVLEEGALDVDSGGNGPHDDDSGGDRGADGRPDRPAGRDRRDRR